MSFGGSPSCTLCGKAVYHVEQVIGPGRKMYHKMCLKCQQCGKRLDQGSVVEHDAMPYCLRCHTQLFGTRDLRHGNVLPPTSSPLRTTTTPISTPQRLPPTSMQSPLSPTRESSSLASTSRPLPRPPTSTTEFYTPPPASSFGLNGSSSTTTTTARGGSIDIPRDIPQSPHDPDIPITRPDFRSSRPISVPYAGGSKALDERGLLKRADSPRSKVGERIMGEDMCEGCGKRVYAAEQVNAIGYKWHKGCLRCTSCKTTVDPSKVTDKDNQVYCKNCYSKNFGPGGILGKR